ncbi:MAG TPA: hypothetical protein VII43_03875 [Opitutaceae bacterium]
MSDPFPFGGALDTGSDGRKWRGPLSYLVLAAGTIRKDVSSLPARPLLSGVVLGFLLCCAAGRIASKSVMFEHFTRFYAPIQASRNFYPTASELVSYVKGTVPRDKYLVLVGGASYFRGLGQNPDELWTLELQRLLGDDYAVVNYANDRAGIIDFAGVAFEALSSEYPRIAYVANASPVVVDSPVGSEAYLSIFWDGYYKGMNRFPAPWADRVADLGREERKDPAGLELHLGKWSDQFTYACDLWTYVGYKYFFTVWTDAMFDSIIRARRRYPEVVHPNLRQEQAAFRANADYSKRYEAGNKDYSTKGFVSGKEGRLEIDPPAFDRISELSTMMFPEELKSKCFLVFIRANPYFMKGFDSDDWRREEDMFSRGGAAFEKAGYHVIQFRSSDFTPDDFYDAGHFMASGGRKVAEAVAHALKASKTEPGVVPK